MDFKVLRQIIGKPWLIEPVQAHNLLASVLPLFESKQAGISKYAPVQFQPEIKNGVAIIPINGPIMKTENCDEPGTANILTTMQQLAANPDIKGFVLQIDSPGGTVDGTQVFAEAIKSLSTQKPVVSFVDGMMASAAYWIGSSTEHIMASTATDMIGSIGTMVSWADFKGMYEQKGVKLHEAYASDSVDKNALFRDANNGDYSTLQKELLDPVNKVFTSTVSANRAGKINTAKENVLTGKIYMAADAIKNGLIDSIGTLDKAVAMVSKINSKRTKQMDTSKNFAATLAVAGAEEFQPLVAGLATETTVNGYLVPEASLDAIEASLAASTVSINNAVARAEAAEGALINANANAAALTEQIAAANTSLQTANERIAVLEQQDGADGTIPGAKGKDDLPGANSKTAAEKYATSFDKMAAEYL